MRIDTPMMSRVFNVNFCCIGAAFIQPCKYVELTKLYWSRAMAAGPACLASSFLTYQVLSKSPRVLEKRLPT